MGTDCRIPSCKFHWNLQITKQHHMIVFSIRAILQTQHRPQKVHARPGFLRRAKSWSSIHLIGDFVSPVLFSVIIILNLYTMQIVCFNSTKQTFNHYNETIDLQSGRYGFYNYIQATNFVVKRSPTKRKLYTNQIASISCYIGYNQSKLSLLPGGGE